MVGDLDVGEGEEGGVDDVVSEDDVGEGDWFDLRCEGGGSGFENPKRSKKSSLLR